MEFEARMASETGYDRVTWFERVTGDELGYRCSLCLRGMASGVLIGGLFTEIQTGMSIHRAFSIWLGSGI